MIEGLTEGFTEIIKRIRGQARLTEANVAETMDLIRTTLIDADVSLPVVDEFSRTVKEQALGHKVLTSLTPSQAMINLVHQELTNLMGPETATMMVPRNEPVVLILAGLQGAGKTTTAAKLALLLRKQKRRVLVTSTDVHRPAAIEQLRILCGQVKVDFHEPPGGDDCHDAVLRATSAVKAAPQTLHDYVLIDTAGRNVLDQALMDELKAVSQATVPAEALLVVDATLGQEALEVARRFDEILALTGVCLTKLDGDARGGAAMSVKATIGVPIKFIGVGERPDDLQPFVPERMASRILGMGDIISLVESATEAMGQKKARKLDRKLRRKHSPGLQLKDMIDQMRQADTMGGVDKIADQLPAELAGKVRQSNVDPRMFKRMEAIYLSMTSFERLNPALIKGSRKQRIAKGAGVEVQQVNQLLNQHAQANKLVKRASKNPAAAMAMMRRLLG